MRMRIVAAAIGLATAILAVSPVAADEALIGRWYAMLNAANADGLAGMLADNVVIRLDDLGVEQDKAAFIASMDEWKVAVAGAGIRFKVEGAEGAVTTVRTCYDFPDNDILMRETFSVAGGLITENRQSRIADDCAAF